MTNSPKIAFEALQAASILFLWCLLPLAATSVVVCVLVKVYSLQFTRVEMYPLLQYNSRRCWTVQLSQVRLDQHALCSLHSAQHTMCQSLSSWKPNGSGTSLSYSTTWLVTWPDRTLEGCAACCLGTVMKRAVQDSGVYYVMLPSILRDCACACRLLAKSLAATSTQQWQLPCWFAERSGFCGQHSTSWRR